MLVLLPPSEGKTSPRRGRPVALDTLVASPLTDTRHALLQAVRDVSRDDPAAARAALGLGPSQEHELDRNTALFEAPTAAALNVYTGVLYAALGVDGWDAASRRRAARRVLIMSALFGIVRPGDRIPAYRLSGDTTWPGVGPVAAVWRDPLAAAIPVLARRRAVLDLRSGAYASFWRPSDDVAERTLVLRVVHQRSDGSRVVVSHHNKAAKGRLVGALMQVPDECRSVDQLWTTLRRTGAEVDEPTSGGRGRPWRADLVVTDV